MRKPNTALVCAAVSFFALAAGSCGNRGSVSGITLQPTPQLATDERVALLIDPYVSFRDIPGPTGITSYHGRRGEIFDVTGKRFVQTDAGSELWFELGNGWVPAQTVQLYSSRERAKTASMVLLE